MDDPRDRRSVTVTSNVHPTGGFGTIMPKTLATAAVDRLLHHAHVIVTNQSSHRLKEARPERGWSPSAELTRRTLFARPDFCCPRARRSPVRPLGDPADR